MKANWPTIFVGIMTVALLTLQYLKIIPPELATMILGAIGTSGVAVAHRMDSPARATLPPKAE